MPTVESLSASLSLIDQRASAVTSTALARLSDSLASPTNILSNITGSISQQLSSITNSITGIVDDIIRRIRELLNQLLESLRNTVGGWISTIAETIGGFIERLAETFANWVGGVIQAFRDAINSVVQTLSDWFSRLQQTVHRMLDRLVATVSQIVSGIREGFSQLIQNLLGGIRDLINTIAQRVQALAGSVIDAARELAGKIEATIRDVVEKVRSAFEHVAETVRTWIQQAIQRIMDFLEDLQARLIKAASEAVRWLRDNVWEPIRKELEHAIRVIQHELQVFDRAARGKYSSLDQLASDLFSPLGVGAGLGSFLVALAGGAAVLLGIGQLVAEALEGVGVTIRRDLRQHFAPPEAAAQAMIKQTAPLGEIEAAYSAAGLSEEQFGVLVASMRQLPDPGTIIANVFRGTLSLSDAINLLNRQGYLPGSFDLFLNAARNLLAPGEVLEALNRGLISEEQARAELRGRGYDEGQISTLLNLRFVIPGISDLIRMMVRDAFNEQVVQKYGYDEDFPEAILEWTRKQGLPDTFTRAYWRAHWELPSPTQGFEMLHRGVIDIEDLRTLLKIADYPPYWRDKLIQISYNPITRVDIRRMYRLGLLTFEEVVERYKHLGYTEEDARALAEFTAKYEQTDVENMLDKITTRTQNAIERAYAKGKIDRNRARELLIASGMPEDVVDSVLNIVDLERELSLTGEEEAAFRTLTREAITDAYRDRLLTRQEAKERLMAIGYAEADAELLLAIEDYRTQAELRRGKIEIAVTRFVEGITTESDFIGELTMLGLTAQEIELIAERAKLQRSKRVKRLSENTLARLLRMGIISPEEYANELRSMGYDEKYIQWLLQSRIVPTGG